MRRSLRSVPGAPPRTKAPRTRNTKTDRHETNRIPSASSRLSFRPRVAALGDIACGVYTNTATVGIPCVTNEWLDSVLHVDWGTSYTPAWWTDYGVTKPNASPAPDAAATTGQLKWCVRQAAALLQRVAHAARRLYFDGGAD